MDSEHTGKVERWEGKVKKVREQKGKSGQEVGKGRGIKEKINTEKTSPKSQEMGQKEAKRGENA